MRPLYLRFHDKGAMDVHQAARDEQEPLKHGKRGGLEEKRPDDHAAVSKPDLVSEDSGRRSGRLRMNGAATQFHGEQSSASRMAGRLTEHFAAHKQNKN